MPTPQSVMHAVVENISRVIVGKRAAAELMLISLLCEGHVLIEDRPGVGKTTLVSAMARSVDCSFRRIQFTPDILPSDITGFSMFNQKSGQFEFKPGLIMSCFVLADEINRTSPKTQASLLEVMEECHVTVDGITYPVGPPFMVMATQNSAEYVGTYPLPEAQIDRFFMRISLGYPEADEEVAILKRFGAQNPLHDLTCVTDGKVIVAMQEMVRRVYVEDSVYRYIVELTRRTREHPDIELGASPRGSLALFRASQANAFYQGRGFVLPDDVKAMSEPTLAHRLILRQEARLRGQTQEALVAESLRQIPVPVVRAHGA